MPTYQVETDRGTYEIELDKEPSSDVELQKIANQHLSDIMHQQPSFLGLTPAEKPTWKTFKSLGKAAVDVAPEMLGATTGGLLTGGSIPGVVGGAMVGRALKETGEHVASQMGPLPEPPKPIGERVKNVGIAGGAALLGEGAGRLAIKGANRLISPGGKEAVPGAIAAAARTEPFMDQAGVGRISMFFGKRKQALTPGQISESNVLDIMENATRSSLIGRRHMVLNDISSKKAMQNMTDDFVSKFGTRASPEEVGHLFLDTLQNNDKAYFAAARELYRKVDDLTQAPVVSVGVSEIGVPEIVPTQSLKDFAKGVVKRRGQGLKSINSPTGGEIINDVLQLPDRISFAEAQFIRSQLIKASAPITESNREVVKGISKELSKLLDNSMEQAAKDLSPEAVEAWRAANAFWKQGKATYRKAIIQSMMKKEDTAEKVVDMIFKPGASSTIKAAKSVVDEATWSKMQRAYLTSIIKNASVDGELKASHITAQLHKMGEPALREIFSGGKTSGLKAIRDLDEVAKLMQDKPTKLSGGLLIQFIQAGAMIQLGEAALLGFSTSVSPLSAGVLVAPPLFARMLTNPITARWLVNGMKLSPGSEEMYRAAGRISSQLVKEIISEQND